MMREKYILLFIAKKLLIRVFHAGMALFYYSLLSFVINYLLKRKKFIVANSSAIVEQSEEEVFLFFSNFFSTSHKEKMVTFKNSFRFTKWDILILSTWTLPNTPLQYASVTHTLSTSTLDQVVAFVPSDLTACFHTHNRSDKWYKGSLIFTLTVRCLQFPLREKTLRNWLSSVPALLFCA